MAGVRRTVSYEGQAAIKLEWLAAGVEPDGVYPFAIEEHGPEGYWCSTPRPMVAAVASDVRRGESVRAVARRFHSTMVAAIVEVCGRLRAATGIDAVALSGGVFLNALLTTETVGRLEERGLRAYRHRQVPPGDGGLCLGQLAIAAARQRAGEG